MTGVCAAITKSGTRCKVLVSTSREYCFQHDPATAEQRRRNAAKGGKAKASRELVAVKNQLQNLADGVLEGELDKAVAAVVSQILNVKLRAIEVERRIKETEELEERLEALEEGRDRWAR